MQYWLIKSEPGVYSWDQLVADGSTVWDGIRSYAARLHLKGMKKGDPVLFYHSNVGKEIVGIATVSRESYPDATAGDEDWVVIEISPLQRFKKPVTLVQVKNNKELAKIALIKIPRLSVMPLTKQEYDTILEMGN